MTPRTQVIRALHSISLTPQIFGQDYIDARRHDEPYLEGATAPACAPMRADDGFTTPPVNSEHIASNRIFIAAVKTALFIL
jgi:hypothetical protein